MYPQPKKLGRSQVVASPEISNIIIAEKKKHMNGISMILAGEKFYHATAEISFTMLNEVYTRYLYITPAREVITDHQTNR